MKHTLLLLFFFSCCFCAAQTRNPALDINRTNVWKFGFESVAGANDSPGLDFSTGSPTLVNGGIDINDGATTISNLNGNLQLYGGLLKMFDHTFSPMSNSGIVGDSGWIGIGQANLAIPMPNSLNIIYYFSSSVTLKYSVVDMNLNGGNGGVVARNVELQPYPTGVKLAAVHHCNGSDIWVVYHKWLTNSFYAFLLTDTGINAIPVITNIGPVDDQQGMFQTGNIKFSNNGNKLAITFSGFDTIPYLFDFDKLTGIVSNPIPLQKDIGDQGIAFSGDNSKLYISTNNGRLLQYDLNAGNPAAITASRKLIAEVVTDYTTMQLARDGKIYVVSGSNPYRKYLGIVNNPNAPDTFCLFVAQGLYMNGAQGHVNSLMNTVDSYFYTGSSAYPCYGDTALNITSINNFNTHCYPNPFSDFTTIEIPDVLYYQGKIEYQLCDATGRICKAQITEIVNKRILLERGQLNAGMYFLSVKLSGKTQVIKLSIL